MKTWSHLTFHQLSLRVGLAMILPLVIGLLITYIVFTQIELGHERAAITSQDLAGAKIIAAELDRVPSHKSLDLIQKFLGDDQLIVYRKGIEIFRGPKNADSTTVPVTYSNSYGTVTIMGDLDSTSHLTLELTLTAALLLLFVLASSASGTWVLIQSVTDPIKRATQVARRVTAGDYSVRINAQGANDFGRLAEAFDTMAWRLEDSDRQQRQFLIDLAHEIATPLNTIAGITLGILDGKIPLDSAREEGQEIVDTELDRIRSLLKDIRSLGLIENEQAVRNEEVDLGIVGERAVRRFSNEALKRSINFRSELRPIKVISDQRMIETVIDNLMTNALRYTPKDGKITLSARLENQEAVLEVADTGVGISPVQQMLIFERFYRTDSARDRERGGTGLGLSIARRAAIAIGGRIEVQSEVGKGSTFRLKFPIHPKDKADR